MLFVLCLDLSSSSCWSCNLSPFPNGILFCISVQFPKFLAFLHNPHVCCTCSVSPSFTILIYSELPLSLSLSYSVDFFTLVWLVLFRLSVESSIFHIYFVPIFVVVFDSSLSHPCWQV